MKKARKSRQASRLPVAWTDANGGRWLAPCNALLPDQACLDAPALAATLVREGLHLSTGLPTSLQRTWQEAMPRICSVTPAAVRAHLKAKGAALALTQQRRPADEQAQVQQALLHHEICSAY